MTATRAPLLDLEPPADPFAATPPVARSRMKRLLDFAGAAILIVLALPVMALIAVAVKLDSPGPVLFRQTRVGLRKRPFTVYKFRSMRNGCDEAPHRRYVKGLVTGESETTNGHGVYKLVGDRRVTRVGAWLRQTSLDELPQLLNVLLGQMSLVGPRPPLPYEVDVYSAVQMRRLACRPGLTGLWQVSGRNQLSYRGMVELDLEYIRTWRPLMDLRILLRTFPVVLRNTGGAH